MTVELVVDSAFLSPYAFSAFVALRHKGVDVTLRRIDPGAGQQRLFDDWCIADVDLALMLMRLVSHGDPVPPHLAACARHPWQAPAVQACVGIERPVGQCAAAAGAR